VGKIIGAVTSKPGLFLIGMAVGVIVDRKTGLVSKTLAATVGRIPGVGALVVG
jgi:hypothetical protein